MKRGKGGDTTLKKKQVLISVSIVGLSFLFGTMFNFATRVTSSGGSPWDEVWTTISELETRVETLEEQSLPEGFVSAPAYDSGWVSIDFGVNTLTHNLGTTELFVFMIGNHPDFKIHQIRYGGGVFGDGHRGVEFLLLTNTTITVWRYGHDPYWHQVRVMIWKISEPPT